LSERDVQPTPATENLVGAIVAAPAVGLSDSDSKVGVEPMQGIKMARAHFYRSPSGVHENMLAAMDAA